MTDQDLHNEMQTAFDIAIRGIVEQGGPSINSALCGASACRYRSEDGRKCAIGWLISDVHYSPDLEGSNVDEVVVMKALVASRAFECPDRHLYFLEYLQAAHDKAVRNRVDFFPEFFKLCEQIAERYGLTVPEELKKTVHLESA